MRPLSILTLLLLTACAGPSGPVVPMAWVPMDNVQEKCGHGAHGCYRWNSGVCTLYTRNPRGPYDEPLHNTLGHEARHCFQGDFHPARQYVDLSRIAQ